MVIQPTDLSVGGDDGEYYSETDLSVSIGISKPLKRFL